MVISESVLLLEVNAYCMADETRCSDSLYDLKFGLADSSKSSVPIRCIPAAHAVLQSDCLQGTKDLVDVEILKVV